MQEIIEKRVTQALNEAGSRQGADLTGTRSNLKLDLSFEWKPSMLSFPEFGQDKAVNAPEKKVPKARLDMD